MDLILETPGTRVGKKQEMLKLDIPETKSIEIPLREIESIIVGNGVQITSQALQVLSSYAVNIIYTSLGKPYGIYTPFANVGTVFTRRQQLIAYNDWRGCHLAIQFVYAAIKNKRRLLFYLAKNRKKSKPNKYAILRAAARKIGTMEESLLKFSKTQAKGKKISDIRMELMGMEGKAAALYFQNYGIALPKPFRLIDRTRRPPTDPINSLLSLGYMVLLGHITVAIAAAGLELYGGFLHSDRSGKPSLALDLIEEFRQPIVDRLVSQLVQKGKIQKDDFDKSLNGFRLKEEKKKVYYTALRREIVGGDTSKELFYKEGSTENRVDTENNDKKVKLNYKREMVRQARKLANFLIGASSGYQPFVMNW